MRSRSPVIGWDELTRIIRERDWGQAQIRLGDSAMTPCVAAFLDLRSLVTCSGRLTNEHVTPGYGRLGVKAKNLEQHVVTLCYAHHLQSFAGFIWATANKDKTRNYLKELYPSVPV